MKKSTSIIFLCLLTVVPGCRKDCEFPKSLRADFMAIPEKIKNPEGINPLAYANLLLNRVVALHDRKEQLRIRKAWEELTYSVQLDANDLRLRYSQCTAFYDIAGLSASCILKIGGTEEDYWESRIRLIKWEQRQLMKFGDKPVVGFDGRRPRSKESVKKQVYWDMFHKLYEVHIQHVERDFNDKTCGRISVDREHNIRRKIENAIGRKIRSNAEILKQIRREGELLRSRLGIGVETDTDVKVR